MEEILAKYNLPELPEETDYDDETVKSVRLVLFRQNDTNVTLGYVKWEDAREYANRDDTHGDGYFVGYMEIY